MVIGRIAYDASKGRLIFSPYTAPAKLGRALKVYFGGLVPMFKKALISEGDSVAPEDADLLALANKSGDGADPVGPTPTPLANNAFGLETTDGNLGHYVNLVQGYTYNDFVPSVSLCGSVFLFLSVPPAFTKKNISGGTTTKRLVGIV